MTIVKHVLLAVLTAALTFAAFVVWAVACDAVRAHERPTVAISEMLAEAAAGHVDEITVRGTRYEFRVDKARTKVAFGPKTTAAELAPLAGRAKIDVED